MIRLDAATVMLQWSVGGLGFLWFTTRRGVAGRGYGMLLRLVYGVFALSTVVLGWRYGVVWVREISAVAVAVASFALVVNSKPRLDLIAPLIGVPGVIAGAIAAADGASSTLVAVLRIIVGTAFLRPVSDAMLLGHWYLVQPGMPRKLLNELTTAVI